MIEQFTLCSFSVGVVIVFYPFLLHPCIFSIYALFCIHWLCVLFIMPPKHFCPALKDVFPY